MLLISFVGDKKEPTLTAIRYDKNITKVVLICSKETCDVGEEIKDIFEKMNLEVEIESIKDPVSLYEILKVLKKYKNKKAIINITGGTKIMAIAGYLFASLSEKANIIYYSPNYNKYYEIPAINKLKKNVGKTKKKILNILEKEKICEKEIAERLNKSKSTISDSIKILEKEKYLTKKGRELELTLAGSLYSLWWDDE